MNDNVLLNTLVNAAISAAIGAGVTVIGFREKLSLFGQRVGRLEEDRKSDALSAAAALLDVRRDFQQLCQSLSDRAADARTADRELFERLYRETEREMRQSERRQRYVMEIVTAIAQKHGITHRVSDFLSAHNDNPEG